MLEGMVEGTSKEFASFGENLTNGRLTEQLVHHQYHGDYHERILSPAAAASSQRYQHHHRQPDHQQQQHENHDFYSELVNINWIGPVRTMIAQNLAEISLICVIIIIYLVYYFSQISKKPKLIGNERSEFVRFVSDNLSNTIKSRFNPLIYFWGTNAQTALFGYLQGQTSTDEMPRNEFRRQYLYVSDAQYLTSNVDLSQHYSSEKSRSNNNTITNKRILQLQVHHPEQQPTSQLDQNVRLVLDELMQQQHQQQHHHHHTRKQQQDMSSQQQQQQQQMTTNNHLVHLASLKRIKELDLSSSSASSSDSGVFPNSGCHSSSSSSTSSLADDSISLDMTAAATPSTTSSSSSSRNFKCRCHSAQPSSSSSPLEFNQLVVNSRQQQQPPIPERTDFGQCALDWHKPSHGNYHKNKLVALISAGMTTGSDKKYVTDTISTLSSLGYEVCVFIRRGVGGLKLSSNKFFSPAKWRDFEAALWSVRQQRAEARLVAVGFSFGSIELCRYLTMSGKQSLVDAALLVSCPFDPEAGGRNMRRRALNRKIDAYLAHSLGKQLYQARISTIQAELDAAAAAAGQTSMNNDTSHDNGNQNNNKTLQGSSSEKISAPNTNNGRSLRVSNFNGSICDLSHLPKLKSLVDFEDNYNRIIQNYPSSKAYAADCRLHEHLQNIQTPTLCLSSEDDFMAPLRLLPLEQIEANDNLCMLLTKRGGHMAFVDGLVWPKKPYFAQRIIGAYMEGIKSRLPAPQAAPSAAASSGMILSIHNGGCSKVAQIDTASETGGGGNGRCSMFGGADSRQPSQDSGVSAKSHWHLIPMSAH